MPNRQPPRDPKALESSNKLFHLQKPSVKQDTPLYVSRKTEEAELQRKLSQKPTKLTALLLISYFSILTS